jgi:hypothetical protein
MQRARRGDGFLRRNYPITQVSGRKNTRRGGLEGLAGRFRG